MIVLAAQIVVEMKSDTVNLLPSRIVWAGGNIVGDDRRQQSDPVTCCFGDDLLLHLRTGLMADVSWPFVCAELEQVARLVSVDFSQPVERG